MTVTPAVVGANVACMKGHWHQPLSSVVGYNSNDASDSNSYATGKVSG